MKDVQYFGSASKVSGLGVLCMPNISKNFWDPAVWYYITQTVDNQPFLEKIVLKKCLNADWKIVLQIKE